MVAGVTSGPAHTLSSATCSGSALPPWPRLGVGGLTCMGYMGSAGGCPTGPLLGPPPPPPAWACPQGGHRAEMVGRRLVPLEPRLFAVRCPLRSCRAGLGAGKGDLSSQWGLRAGSTVLTRAAQGPGQHLVCVCGCALCPRAHAHTHKRAAVWEDHFRPVSWACCCPGPSCGAGISVQTPPGRSGRPGRAGPESAVQLGRPGSPGAARARPLAAVLLGACCSDRALSSEGLWAQRPQHSGPRLLTLPGSASGGPVLPTGCLGHLGPASLGSGQH